MDQQRPYYGFLSNCYTSALVGPDGTVEWLPFPRFDGDAIFCRLLDDTHGGYLAMRPRDAFTVSQRYVPETLILETRFLTDLGCATIEDFLTIGRNALWRHVTSEMPLVLTCVPTFGFGYASASYQVTSRGAIFSHPRGSEGLRLEITGPMVKSPVRDEWVLSPGTSDVVVSYLEHAEEPSRPLPDADRTLATTKRFWQSSLTSYHGKWAEWFHQSMLVVRGLTHRTNGALLAAATTSLPEVVGEGRQWDYRMAWVRDGSYGAEALLLSGDPVGCRQYLEFMFNVTDLVGKPFASPFYRVDGTTSTREQSLLWLSGHRSSRPVRVGNAAGGQLQLDIEGDLLWTVLLYWQATHDRTFIRDYWWAISALAEWVRENSDQPDASLWEFRGEPDYYTHSQVLCWVALHTASVLSEEAMDDAPLASRYAMAAEKVARSVWQAQADSGLPYFTQSRRNPVADAALLTLPLYGFLDVHHPTFQRTLEVIESRLCRDGLVFRYEEDAMGRAQYPFTLAGFWLARVYLQMGERTRADATIGRQLAMATDLKLFAEHVDPTSGEPRGNFPQLFPHAAVVTTLTERQTELLRPLPEPTGEVLGTGPPS